MPNKSDIQIELDWSALEINHCPKDDKELPNAVEGMVSCECGFRIRESRYKEIVKSLENPEDRLGMDITGDDWGDRD